MTKPYVTQAGLWLKCKTCGELSILEPTEDFTLEMMGRIVEVAETYCLSCEGEIRLAEEGEVEGC